MNSTIPPTPKAADRVSAIARVLQDNIMSGHYAPGDRLPSEADLCSHFAVSRPTLREALGRLTARGLLVARRGAGGGAFVTRPSPDMAGEQIAALIALSLRGDGESRALLTEARIQVQIGCAELAALRGSDIGDLRAEIDMQSDFSISEAEFVTSMRRMHLSLAAACGNPAMTMVAQGVIDAEYAQTPRTGYPVRVRARFLSYHVRIANGIGGNRIEDARAALLELWRLEQDLLAHPGGEAPPAPAERPPRMRDLRLPRVQRLTATETPQGDPDLPAAD